MPPTLRKVSCWPANDASGRSSAVAEERTAKLASGTSRETRVYSSRICFSSSGGIAPASTQAADLRAARLGKRVHVVHIHGFEGPPGSDSVSLLSNT